MQHIGQIIHRINGLLKTYLILLALFLPVLPGINSIAAQANEPEQLIQDLKEGILLVRMPTFRAKIDTLKSMLRRSNPAGKGRLEKMLSDTEAERDSLLVQYKRAFRDVYNFSDVAYYFDYEGRDLQKAKMYSMNGQILSHDSISGKPVFYLFFERTKESAIDALIIHDAAGNEIPSAFPNRFIQGGFNFLFLKISEKSFPGWRVNKMNKKLHRYWKEVI